MRDIPLKDGDGHELIEARRSTLGYLPLVVITGLVGSEAQSRIVGCDLHLTKPADPRDLVAPLSRDAARVMKPLLAEPAKATRLKVENKIFRHFSMYMMGCFDRWPDTQAGGTNPR